MRNEELGGRTKTRWVSPENEEFKKSKEFKEFEESKEFEKGEEFEEFKEGIP